MTIYSYVDKKICIFQLNATISFSQNNKFCEFFYIKNPNEIPLLQSAFISLGFYYKYIRIFYL